MRLNHHSISRLFKAQNITGSYLCNSICSVNCLPKFVTGLTRVQIVNCHQLSNWTKTRTRRSKLEKFDEDFKDPVLFTNNNTMASSSVKPQNFDYFLILDFEATCEKDVQLNPQEIIEFPVLKINSKTLETESIFHQYVQPRVNHHLTDFCTQLTGIIQDMVDGKPHLEETLKSFHEWMKKENLLDPNVKSLFVTCGDWDLNKMLTYQCDHFKIDVPDYFKRWLNIKKAFAEVTSTYPKGMMPMLHKLDIPHTGRHHSGIDDCKNIGNILCELVRRGYVAKPSGFKR